MGGDRHFSHAARQTVDDCQESLPRVSVRLIRAGPLSLDDPHAQLVFHRPLGIGQAARPAPRHRQAEANLVGMQGVQGRPQGLRGFGAMAVKVQSLSL